MRCSDNQKKLDIYDLLSARERKEVDIHIATCPECAAAFERIKQVQALIRKAGSVKPEPDDPLDLTGRIMYGIEQEPSGRRDLLPSISIRWIRIQPLRYAYGIVSLLLIAGFVYETMRPVQPMDKSIAVASVPTEVPLNTAVFLKKLEKARGGASAMTMLQCIRACRAENGSVVCYDCKKQYTKLYSKL